MTDYDKAARYLIKRDPTRVLRWLLVQSWIIFHLWIDSRRLALPDQGDLTHDLVAAIRVRDGFEALCLEVQAESEEASAGRVLFGYVPRLRSEPASAESLPLSAIGGVVINLTGRARTSVVRESPTSAPQCRLEAEVTQITLQEMDAGDFLDQVGAELASRWLLAWLSLMQGGLEPGIIDGWKREAALLPTERDRQVLAHLTLTFADLAGCRDVWQRALEGWTMIKSPYMEEVREAVRKEGREEGRLEGQRETLLRLGRKKFGRGPSKKQLAELDAITNPARLAELSERLLDVDTWGELLAAL